MQELLKAQENMGPLFPILQQEDGQSERQVGQFYYDDEKDHMKTKVLYCLRMTPIDISAEDLDYSFGRRLFPDEIPVRPMRCERVMMLALTNPEKEEFRRVGLGEIDGLTWFDGCQESQITIV